MDNKNEYTKKEIDSKINVLTTQMNDLIFERKALNKLVAEKRKQVTYWEEFDLSQYKAF
jgi:hypothetical protein